DLDDLASGFLFDGAGAVQQEQVWRSGPIQDRHFGAVEGDAGVVDSRAGQGGEDVLDSADPDVRVVRVGQDGAEVGVDHVVVAGRDGAIAVGAVEDDAGVRIGGRDGQRDAAAGMDSDSGAVDR